MDIQRELKSITSEGDLKMYRAFLDEDTKAQNLPNMQITKQGLLLTEFLQKALGRPIRAQFIINGRLVTKCGILKRVDGDFFILHNNKANSEVLCRIDKLIFLNAL